ncbi:hypothetical protein J3F83DRAFT_650910 [Trichoderma novae-zelandiae]
MPPHDARTWWAPSVSSDDCSISGSAPVPPVDACVCQATATRPDSSPSNHDHHSAVPGVSSLCEDIRWRCIRMCWDCRGPLSLRSGVTDPEPQPASSPTDIHAPHFSHSYSYLDRRLDWLALSVVTLPHIVIAFAGPDPRTCTYMYSARPRQVAGQHHASSGVKPRPLLDLPLHHHHTTPVTNMRYPDDPRLAENALPCIIHALLAICPTL